MSLVIAFTSCARFENFPAQPVWGRIAARKPDILLLLGDQIYMDYWPDLRAPEKEGWSDEKFKQTMEEHYKEQLQQPEFRVLLAAVRSAGGVVLPIWDDHDFAWNGACGANVDAGKVAISTALFRTYMKPPQQAAAQGIYYSHVRGGIRFVMLDTRTFREEPGSNRQLLGAAQTNWSRNQISLPAEFIIICAGSPLTQGRECWRKYPEAYDDFLGLIAGKKVLFVAGDIHENEFLVPSKGRSHYEVISSGAAIYKFAFVGLRQNYGVLTIDDDRVVCELVDKQGQTAKSVIGRADWKLVGPPGFPAVDDE